MTQVRHPLVDSKGFAQDLWYSKKHSIAALSTTKIRYATAATGSGQSLLVNQLLEEWR